MNRYHFLAIFLTAFAILLSNMSERPTVGATEQPTTETRIRCNIPNIIPGRPLHEAYTAIYAADKGDLLDFSGEVFYTLPGQETAILVDEVAEGVEVKGLEIVNYGCETFEDEILYIGDIPIHRANHVVYDSTVLGSGLIGFYGVLNESNLQNQK